MLEYRLEDRSESVLGKSKTSKCIRVLVVVVVVRAAAAARYLRHAKSTYMVKSCKSPLPCCTHAPGGLAAVSRRRRVPDMPDDVLHPDRGHGHHPELSYGIRRLAFITEFG